MAERIIGREAELAAGERFLDALAAGPAALVIEGEPGIGKTTIWRGLSAVAEARGLRLLSCRPAETEAKLAYSALADLLREVVEETLRALPEPQRRALEVALLRIAPEGRAPDQRTVGTALFSVLELLAGRSSVVVAVDDVQWLDPPSARILEYAFRRLSSQPVGILLALRSEAEAQAPLSLDRVLPAERVQRLRLGPLSLAALHHLLVQQLDQHFARPALLRIEEASGGNPLFALELARSLLRVGERAGRRVPLPETLEKLVRGRLRALPARTLEALALAAASSRPSLRLLESLGHPEDDLTPAEAAGVVSVEEGWIVFAHPLLASRAYYSLTGDRRRSLHRNLAQAVSDPEERARHLALGAAGPDVEVAAALEHAAALARVRGAPDAAAELAEQARRLTPVELQREAARRAAKVGEYLFEAGDNRGSRRLLEEAVTALEPGDDRAQALVVLAQACNAAGSVGEAVHNAEQALAEPATDPLVRGQAHFTLGELGPNAGRDLASSAQHLEAAVGLFSERDAPELLAAANCHKLFCDVLIGRRVDVEEFKRLSEIDAASGSFRVWSGAAGEFFLFIGDVEAARRHTETTLRRRREEGTESPAAEVLAHLARVELAAGNWTRADEHSAEACRLVEEIGSPTPATYAGGVRAIVAAHLGNGEEARNLAQAGVEWAESRRHRPPFLCLWALGFLALSAGEGAEAAHAFGCVTEYVHTAGARHAPLGLDWNYAEALVAIDELERAQAMVRSLDELAGRIPAPLILGTAGRCRGLLCGARGDLDAALAALEQALAEHKQVPMPFELARTLLVKGQLHRRRGEKRSAQEALTQALAVFERLPAPLWEDKARGELARVGLRRHGRDELTASELRVAQLAASGLTNREVAKIAFMSPKTVEGNLSRAYRKLRIRTRAELGAKMAELGGGEQPR